MSDLIPRGEDGHVHQKLWVWSPETIEDIQTKAELGRYRIRGLGTTRRTPHFDDLTFVPCALSRIPLEGYREACNTAIEIGARHGAKPIRLRTPIIITGMSYGALSRNAKRRWARRRRASASPRPPATAACSTWSGRRPTSSSTRSCPAATASTRTTCGRRTPSS